MMIPFGSLWASLPWKREDSGATGAMVRVLISDEPCWCGGLATGFLLRLSVLLLLCDRVDRAKVLRFEIGIRFPTLSDRD